MVDNHYRWDFIGLSTDEKPTPETSEKVANGSTFYCSDNSKLYVWYKNQWYEKVVEGGGGGTSYTAGDGINISNNEISVDTTTIQPKLTAGTNITIDANNVISAEGGGGATVVQTTGNSTADVMSQDATTKMIYMSSSTLNQLNIPVVYNSKSYIRIGENTETSGKGNIAIGFSAQAGTSSTHQGAIAIGSALYGSHPKAGAAGAIAIGEGSQTATQGVFTIGGLASFNKGYNNSQYRLLTGLYDGQSAHDAVTVEQVNATIDAINAALSTSIPHIGA